ncbi:uncharacterized protein L203_106096 [Cryptococcus depauperatus CBS 7841]|uniref:Uncharacterized protein n=1 Tax=Cryptococcus depauperatus CBS 7841 TaxID=1295531 RepID=A0A1E3IX84_9TREE|nr:hypothetical protein L203_00803 [Cryptococcus depauperatus CBS 7841]
MSQRHSIKDRVSQENFSLTTSDDRVFNRVDDISFTGGKSLEARAHKSSTSISSFKSSNTITATQSTGQIDAAHDADKCFLGLQDQGSFRNDSVLHRIPLTDTTASININMTPSSTSIASEFSTPAEVSLGPQSLPFALRRRDVLDQETPSKIAILAHIEKINERTNETAATVLQVEPKNLILLTEPAQVINEVPSTHQAKQTQPERRLSLWRRDQIKKAKQPELLGDTVPRPIPTLYGPLSLPYARNPSGVDATVADESAYLSHVFGLRPASGGAHSTVGTESFRTVSSGTQSSGTQSYRSASGTSVYHAKKLLETNSISDCPEFGELYQARPLIISDSYPNDGFGEKKLLAKYRYSNNVIPFQFETIPFRGAAETDEVNVNTKSGIDLNNAESRRVVSDSVLLEPKLGTSVIGPSKSYANLREYTKLSPIPGSPAQTQRKTDIIAIHDAFKSRIRSASMSRVDPHHPISSEDYTASYATPIRIPAFLPVHYNLSQPGYDLLISNDQGHEKRSARQNTSPNQRNAHIRGTSAQFSKADVSNNWRNKPQVSTKKFKQLYTPVMPQLHSPIANNFRNDESSQPLEPKIMTIDKLFEKFSPQAQLDKAQVSFQSPIVDQHNTAAQSQAQNAINVAMTKSTPQTSRNLSASQDFRPFELIAQEQNSQPISATSYLSKGKGTPGAGRLLKKSAHVDTDEDEASTEAEMGTTSSRI